MSTLHQAATRFTAGMQFVSQINGAHELTIDTTEAGGGQDSGPSPKPLLLTSLGGCTGMDVVSLLNKMHVNFSDFSVNVEADLRDEHPRIYTEIRMVYKIKIAEADRDKMEKAVSLSKDKYCGVSAMLAMVCPILSRVEYV